MSETKFYDVDGDRYMTSIEEDDTSVVPRIGETILWEGYTYKAKTILHDIEDGLVVITVNMTGVEEGCYGHGGPSHMTPQMGVIPVAIYPIVYGNRSKSPKTAPFGDYYSLYKLYADGAFFLFFRRSS